MGAIIPKDYCSLDEILVKIKIKLQGWKREEAINTTAADERKLLLH